MIGDVIYTIFIVVGVSKLIGRPFRDVIDRQEWWYTGLIDFKVLSLKLWTGCRQRHLMHTTGSLTSKVGACLGDIFVMLYWRLLDIQIILYITLIQLLNFLVDILKMYFLHYIILFTLSVRRYIGRCLFWPSDGLKFVLFPTLFPFAWNTKPGNFRNEIILFHRNYLFRASYITLIETRIVGAFILKYFELFLWELPNDLRVIPTRFNRDTSVF